MYSRTKIVTFCAKYSHDRFLIEHQGYGAVANWKKGPFPMNLGISEKSFRETGFESISTSRIRAIDYSVRNEFRNLMRTELNYHYQDYDQKFRLNGDRFDIRNNTHLRSHDLDLLNTLFLNKERTSYLSSNIRLFKQTGTQKFDSFNWSERLFLRHSPKLSSYYLASLLENKLAQTTVNSYNAEAGVDYLLYQSLTAHFDLHGRRSDFAEESDEEYGPTGRLTYRKNTPWGFLTAGYGRTLNQVNRTGDESASRNVIGEQVTIFISQLQFLSQPDVETSSIVVHSLDRHVTYTENFDYRVETRGNRTSLRVLGGGLLSDGASVLVDYDVKSSNKSHFLSDEQAFNARLRF